MHKLEMHDMMVVICHLWYWDAKKQNAKKSKNEKKRTMKAMDSIYIHTYIHIAIY